MPKFKMPPIPKISCVKNIPPPPIRVTRRLARLSQGQMAAIVGFSTRSLSRWESGRAKPNRMAEKVAWLVYLAFVRPDPLFGWLKACLGLAPDGTVPPAILEKLDASRCGLIHVPEHFRRGRTPRPAPNG